MLVSRQGDRDFVKVLDFGLAKVAPEALALDGKAVEQVLTKHGTVFGTPKYMAPEQCICQAVDARTDLYALGLILFEMLAGAHPFAAKDTLTIVRHQLTTPTPSIASVAPAVRVAAAVEAVVQRLTDKRPENRFASATAVHAALAELAEQTDGSEVPAVAAVGRSGEAAKTVASMELVSVAELTPAVAAAAVATPPAGPAPAASSGPTPNAFTAGPNAAGPATTPVAGAAAAPSNPGAAAPAKDPVLAPVAGTATTAAAGGAPLGSPAARAVAAGGDAVPALLARLPPALQQRPALLLVPVALFGLFLVWLLHSPSPSTPRGAPGRAGAGKSSAPSAQAPQAQLDQAIAGGAPALIELAKQFPGDARVKRAIAHTYMAQRNGMDALRWLAKVLALDTSLVPEGELLQAAKLAFVRPELADDAIAMLEGELGERGIDALFLLAVRPGPIRLKLKFNQSLAKPEVRKRASRATQVAMELRAASQCEQKRALLPRAAQYGDRRALAQLQGLVQKQNCGPYGLADCGACLRQDDGLQRTIAAITTRLGADN